MSITFTDENARVLRLVWPQWQGAGRDVVASLLPEVPLGAARRGYAVGAQVLQAILPAHSGPTEFVDVPTGDEEDVVNGIESRDAILESLGNALAALSRHDAERVLTLGGDCSVSVAPFSTLAERYGNDLAVVWIDSHPDVDTPETGYPGYHAMAVSTLLGHGAPEIVDMLPATLDPSRVALAGLHSWEEDAYANVAAWGLATFPPDDLRVSTEGLLTWLASTGASKVAIHLDVDTVDSHEVVLGLGQVPGGLTSTNVRRVVTDLAAAADVVGMTVAEFIPRTVLAAQELLTGLPLLSP